MQLQKVLQLSFLNADLALQLTPHAEAFPDSADRW
jgi:hypothetical protein